MIGIEIVSDKNRKERFPPTKRVGFHIAEQCRTLGLLIRPIGDILILMPPLSASTKELQQMVNILTRAIALVRTQASEALPI